MMPSKSLLSGLLRLELKYAASSVPPNLKGRLPWKIILLPNKLSINQSLLQPTCLARARMRQRQSKRSIRRSVQSRKSAGLGSLRSTKTRSWDMCCSARASVGLTEAISLTVIWLLPEWGAIWSGICSKFIIVLISLGLLFILLFTILTFILPKKFYSTIKLKPSASLRPVFS